MGRKHLTLNPISTSHMQQRSNYTQKTAYNRISTQVNTAWFIQEKSSGAQEPPDDSCWTIQAVPANFKVPIFISVTNTVASV